jgi:hypothetical protein
VTSFMYDPFDYDSITKLIKVNESFNTAVPNLGYVINLERYATFSLV